MIKPEKWTEEQKAMIDLLLYRLVERGSEKWTNDETMKTYYFYPDLCTSEEEMEMLKEVLNNE